MDSLSYQLQLDHKVQQLQELMAPFKPPALQIFPSPPQHFRMRAEFKIWHEDDESTFAMFTPAPERQKYSITSFPLGSLAMNQLMPPIIAAINDQPVLKKKLYEVHFLTSTTGDVLVTMIYHKAVDGQWQHAANALREHLGITIVGRSRGQKVVLGKDYVDEEFTVLNRTYYYRHSENSFTQPNGHVCQQMLNWACEHTRQVQPNDDLLELYCGNGNFTLPLAGNFNRVLANEISKASTADALYNLAVNNIQNVEIVRMSSQELTEALSLNRPFRRLADIDLTTYNFSTVFVDPPRAGLDVKTLEFIAQFARIVYISCNHQTLVENMQQLAASHEIQAFALFDQFPFSEHIETGVVLQRRVND